MSWRRSWAIARHELRLLAKDPTFAIILTVMPLLLMAFIKPAFRYALISGGEPHANGAEQAVPGMSVMFAFYMVGNVGFAVFREHAWATWDRLRASPARPAEIMIGKVAVPLALLGAQLAVLFVVGGALFGLSVKGSMAGLVLVAAALDLCLVSMGLAFMAVCRSVNQLNAAANLGGTFFAGLGGALVPLSLLPGWARAIAPAAPSYWAMRGFKAMILGTSGAGSVFLPVLVLVGFAAAFCSLAATRFRFEDAKVGWA